MLDASKYAEHFPDESQRLETPDSASASGLVAPSPALLAALRQLEKEFKEICWRSSRSTPSVRNRSRQCRGWRDDAARAARILLAGCHVLSIDRLGAFVAQGGHVFVRAFRRAAAGVFLGCGREYSGAHHVDGPPSRDGSCPQADRAHRTGSAREDRQRPVRRRLNPGRIPLNLNHPNTNLRCGRSQHPAATVSP